MRRLRISRSSVMVQPGSWDGAPDQETGLPSAMFRRGCYRPALNQEVARVRSARGPYSRTSAKKAGSPRPAPRAELSSRREAAL